MVAHIMTVDRRLGLRLGQRLHLLGGGGQLHGHHGVLQLGLAALLDLTVVENDK